MGSLMEPLDGSRVLLPLLEDELVVILVHLGNVMPQKVLVSHGRDELLWNLLLLKLLSSLRWVKDRSVDGHGLLQI